MAIASPSAPSFCCTTPSASTQRRRFSHPISWRSASTQRSLPLRAAGRPATVSRLNASSDDEVMHELSHGRHRRRRGGFPVYVALPVNVVDPTAQAVRRKKAMEQSFRALAVAGVEGVVMEVWWGVVEAKFPGIYDWRAYLEIVEMAERFGLNVRAVLAFHQRGSGPRDPLWIPLPQWVLEDMDRDPNISFSDKYGRMSKEYISLGCDVFPVLHGRSPIQAYGDLMRNFRETFGSYLGGVITGVQVGLGPGGELRYPSCPTQNLSYDWQGPLELGEFQCYDKYMIASLNACACEIGKRGWGNGGPLGASSLWHDPESTQFFRADGEWKTPYGEFFLEWYSGMLLLHGERICREAAMIFRDSEINMSGKVAGLHWPHSAESHPLELTCGYYNTADRDGLTPIVRMFGRNDFSLCFSGIEMQDGSSRPDTFVKQLLIAARNCKVSMEGENFYSNLDDDLYQQVVRMSKSYCGGAETPLFSFNLVRMDRSLFEPRNWVSFMHFVRQMSSEANSYIGGGGGGGGGGGSTSSPLAVAAFTGAVVSY